MSVTIKLKYLRHSPRKLRATTRLFNGKNLTWAINQTSVMPQHSALYLKKALLMAQAAAKQKEYDPETLEIKAIQANDGPKIKRMRPTARGRSSKYIKHLSHLVITVGEPIKKEDKKTKTNAEKKD
jgi:large subunit ribosomal protein L22